MELRLAAAAGVSDLGRATLFATLWAVLSSGEALAQAQSATEPVPPRPITDEHVLGAEGDSLRIDSVTTRITSFNQFGYGYQSQAGPVLGPGSERAMILEPQLEIVASQGDRVRHVLTVPIDVISAASPDAIDQTPASADVVSSASRRNIAGTIDWAATYRLDGESDFSINGGLHLEEPFRSWHGGLGTTYALADGATVLSARFLEVFDWFDRFDITGHRHGRADRSSTTGSVGLTQILTSTTVVNANYGITVQEGELGNTWNSVPLSDLTRGPEIFPNNRVRHALVGRASQFLPWNGALRGYYRFYADSWGVVAHSIEAELLQRLSPALYIGALYRFHTQTGVDFFTTLAPLDAPLRTADSDLAPLDAQTIGGRLSFDLPVETQVRWMRFEVGYERYFRTNGLTMDIVTCATGYRF
jgi:uncharacterized protein DUF3570